METENLDEPPNLIATTTTSAPSMTVPQLPPCAQSPRNHNDDEGDPTTDTFPEDYDYIDSNCSTPYVSAPSSPGRSTSFLPSGGGGYFYSAPASPMHFLLSNAAANSARSSGYVPSPSESSLTGGSGSGSFEFEFSARFGSSSSSKIMMNKSLSSETPAPEIGSMSSADELFLNGQIRPMKLSSHLQRPQFLAPLIDIAESEGDEEAGSNNNNNEQGEEGDKSDVAFPRSRTYWRLRDKSLRRRARSMSPMRNSDNASASLFDWCEPDAEAAGKSEGEDQKLGEVAELMLRAQQQGSSSESGGRKGEGVDGTTTAETTPCSASASSSRCSSAGRSSKRWVFLKDFLRSKSEGRNNVKFWSNISFSQTGKEKKGGSGSSSQQGQGQQKPQQQPAADKGDQAITSGGGASAETQKQGKKGTKKSSTTTPPPMNGIRMGKRRVPLSAHEMHYTTNRAQAEEMRKKTYLPYRQGLLGCLGFSSKSYGAMNGFARALNPVSSR